MALRPLLALAALLLPAIASSSLLDDTQQHHCGGACPQGGATAALHASLHGSGAHRQLVYRLTLQCPMAEPAGAAAAQQPPLSGCGEAALLQPLPPAIFADVYQLDNVAAMGQGPAVRLFGPVDVESIERFSQPTLLAVYSGPTQAAGQQVGFLLVPLLGKWLVGHGGYLSACRMSRNAALSALLSPPPSPVTPPLPPHPNRHTLQEGNCTELTLTVPLHARYPHPTNPQQQPQPRTEAWQRWLGSLQSTAAVAELPLPLVLARCPAAREESAAEWQVATLQPASAAAAAAEPVSWVLPAGNLRHGPLVAAGTAAALGCGVAAVLAALCLPLSQPRRAQRKRSKQA